MGILNAAQQLVRLHEMGLVADEHDPAVPFCGLGGEQVAGLAVPAGTVRGWIRAARQSAAQLRVTGIRTVLASGHDELLSWTCTGELGAALEHLTAAALVLGRRHGLERTCWWARINVLTRGRLLTMAPAG